MIWTIINLKGTNMINTQNEFQHILRFFFVPIKTQQFPIIFLCINSQFTYHQLIQYSVCGHLIDPHSEVDVCVCVRGIKCGIR